MRNLISILLVTITLNACSQEEETVYMFSYFKGKGEDGLHLAYSTDGYKFTPLHGDSSFLVPELTNDKLMRDPCIIQGPDGLFHLVWTVSWWDKGIGYASSKDLIHWSEQQYIPVMAFDSITRNSWAPELFYDEINKQYIIYWSSTIPGKFMETDSSAESGLNHRIYCTTTKDFKTFTETKLFYDPGFCAIDATIQKNGDTYLMFIKNETKFPKVAKDIRLVTSKNLTGPYEDAGNPFTPAWSEGPTAIKIGDEWIVYYDMYRQKKMNAMKSGDLKTWTDISDQIEFPEGTRHGTVFKVSHVVLDNLLK
ncbi:MAG: glycoside hydrolase family 43 protein [Bacteroidales bacterium]|nr:glycoside hydrolase family 43 protein [Bacteroidales bacterium]